MANDLWKLQFPNATVLHLPATQSDHCPLLLRTAPNNHNLIRPFKFESMWTDHISTECVINEAWKRGHTLVSKIKNTKMTLKRWNKETFGHVQTRIMNLKKAINRMQGQVPNSETAYDEQAKQ